MTRPRRIEIGERIVNGWNLRSYIWEDVDSGRFIGYNHHYQRMTSGGFMEFVRFDLHKRGEPSEDAPHVHVRLQSRLVPRLDESIKMFGKVLGEIPRIERVVE